MLSTNRKRVLRPIAIILIGLVISVQIANAEDKVREVSVIEVEDQLLIQNLYKDKRYQFVKDEAEDYLRNYPTGLFRAEVLFYQAQTDVILKNYAAAQASYEQIVRHHQDSLFLEEALYYGAVILVREGNPDLGKSYFIQLREKFPESKYIAKTEYPLGKMAFDDSQWEQAEEYLRKAIKARGIPKDQKLDAQRLLAWSFYFQEKRESAIKWFIILLNLDIDDDSKAEICFRLGIEAFKDKEYGKAIDWHEKQMSQWPHEMFRNKSRFRIAEALFATHKQADKRVTDEDKYKAIKLYSANLLDLEPFEPELSRLHRGRLYLSLKENQKAEGDFEFLQNNIPAYYDNIEMTLVRADLNYKMGNWPKTIELMERVLTSLPEKKNDFWFLVDLAKTNEQLAQEKVYEVFNSEMTGLKSRSYYDHQTTQYYETAYQNVPDGEIENRLTMLAILVERHEKAKNFERVVDLYKDVIKYHNDKKKIAEITLYISKLYLNHFKDKKSARIWLLKLHKKANNPENFEASSLLSKLALEKKDLKSATVYLRDLTKQPIKGTKWYVEANFRLAELYQVQEYWRKAVYYYSVVAKTKKQSVPRTQARKRLKEIQSYLKQLKAAKEAQKKTTSTKK